MPNNYTPIEAQRLLASVAPKHQDQIAEALRHHKMLRHIDLTSLARQLGIDDAKQQLAAISYYDIESVVEQYYKECQVALEAATKVMVLYFPEETRDGIYSATLFTPHEAIGTSKHPLEHNPVNVSVTVTQDDTRFGKPLPLFQLGYARDRFASNIEGAIHRLVPNYHSRIIRSEHVNLHMEQ